MRKDNVIGVIGGMGPYAGLDLVKKIFDQTVADSDFTHLPVVLISYPERIPDRAPFLLGESDESPVPALAEIARQLEAAGAVVAGMPCNTAHGPAIFDSLLDSLATTGNRLRILNMIDETARFVRDHVPGARTVGLLHTLAVYRLKLYETAIREVGLIPVEPDEDVQIEVVNPVIYDAVWGIKTHSNPVTPKARQSLIDSILHLRDKGADTVVLGCTEFPLAVTESEIEGVTLVDPTVILARALIRETYPEQLKPL